jgi:hypothetical protein
MKPHNKTKTNASKYMKLTQENLVLNFLTNGGRIASGKARTLGVANPSAVINNLRNKGHEIYSNVRKTGGHTSFWTLSLPSEDSKTARDVLRAEVLYTV